MTRELFKRKSFWIVVLPLFVVVILGPVILMPSREPRYHGRPLSYWVDQLPITIMSPNGVAVTSDASINSAMPVQVLAPQVPGMGQEATNAIQELGERCLPYLVLRLRARDPVWKTRCSLWAMMLGVKNLPWKPKNILTAGQAVTALDMLGGRAQSAVPKLRKLARDKDPFIRDQANHVLAKLEKSQP